MSESLVPPSVPLIRRQVVERIVQQLLVLPDRDLGVIEQILAARSERHVPAPLRLVHSA